MMVFESNVSAGRIAIAVPVMILPLGLLGLDPDSGDALALIGGLGLTRVGIHGGGFGPSRLDINVRPGGTVGSGA